MVGGGVPPPYERDTPFCPKRLSRNESGDPQRWWSTTRVSDSPLTAAARRPGDPQRWWFTTRVSDSPLTAAARRKAFPRERFFAAASIPSGWCSAQRIKILHDCRGQSYHNVKGSSEHHCTGARIVCGHWPPQKYPPERLLRGAGYHVGHGILAAFLRGAGSAPGNSR